MKKLLLPLSLFALSASAIANQNIDQLKLKTIKQVYKEGYSNHLTPDFNRVLDEAAVIDNKKEFPGDYCDTPIIDIDHFGEEFDPSKPKIKIQGDKVIATLLQFKDDPDSKLTVTFSLECKNNKCLISDFGVASDTDKVDSFKDFVAQCTKESK